MTKLLTRILVITLTPLLAGCFTIKKERNPEDSACNLVTRELSLDVQEASYPPQAVLVVGTTSLVVSSSIVLVGNMLHWVEKTGRCSDEQVNQFASKHTAKAVADGGKVIEPPENFSEWLKQRKAENIRKMNDNNPPADL